jgi:DNA repair protein RecN (Recombination protein N)
MLRFLKISNLAVIDQLEFELEPGFTVLTGETGAGKSILVGAVGLLVGGRASAELVRTGEDQATIEAIFETGDGERVVRREISSQGRSRAYVDGSLLTSAALRETCGGLVDLHGQHEHQLLLDPASHLDLLDEFAGLTTLRGGVATAFSAWTQLEAEKHRLVSNQRDAAARADFLRFQVTEVERIGPKAGEDAELDAARHVLVNADRLRRLCSEAYTSLYEGDDAALPALGVVWRRIGELSALDPRFQPYLEARDPIKSQLEDLAFFLRSYSNDIDASPARLQEVEDRLAALDRLKKKHGPTLDEVLAAVQRMRGELSDMENTSERAAALEASCARARADYVEKGGALSSERRRAAPVFCRDLTSALADLAMGRTRCDVRFSDPADERGWSERGFETGELYLSPNPGEELRPLARIASGGELSRIMLALRTLGATDAPGKTLIFDEVDAGIGGAVADVVGRRLQALADRFQVVCITHLPQIAAYGAAHYRISKTVRRTRTITAIERLTGSDREEELARMIGGSEPSPAVRASAREILAARAKTVGRKRS